MSHPPIVPVVPVVTVVHAASKARPRRRPSLCQKAQSLRQASAATPALDEDAALLGDLLSRSLPPEACASAVAILIERFGSTAAVLGADPGEIQRSSRLPCKAIADLMLLRRLAVALARVEASREPVLSSWSALLAYLRAELAHRPREQFRTLFLDKKNRLLRDEICNDGTVDHAPLYPREIVRRALELNASALVLVHNHPSGDPAPSQADIAMTRKIVDACRALELQVHDHVVVAREAVASFRALGLM